MPTMEVTWKAESIKVELSILDIRNEEISRTSMLYTSSSYTGSMLAEVKIKGQKFQ